MADRKVIQHIDSRLGKRGKREMFDFAGDKAYEKINEYMEELHVTADELNEYKTEAVASADRADAASSAANSAADAASSAASSAADAAQEANKAATAMDEAMEVCNKAAADASGSATVAEESATSAQEAAEEARKSAERAELAGGVKSFNGRDGAVAAQAGDYTAEMVGALAQSDVVSTYSATGTAPVNGQAVAEAISNVKIDTDAELSATSTNPVQNKAIVNGGPAILGALDTTSNTPSDSAYYITSFNDTYRRRKFSTLWSYIQGKLSSVLGITVETVTTLQKAVEGKADKATTLAGYGITDGASKSEVTALTTAVNDKADASTVTAIGTSVKELQSGKQSRPETVTYNLTKLYGTPAFITGADRVHITVPAPFDAKGATIKSTSGTFSFVHPTAGTVSDLIIKDSSESTLSPQSGMYHMKLIFTTSKLTYGFAVVNDASGSITVEYTY